MRSRLEQGQSLWRIALVLALVVLSLSIAPATPAVQGEGTPPVEQLPDPLPTDVPPLPTEVPPAPTEVPPPPPPPTEIPPTAIPPTEIPLPTDVPPTEVPPTEIPPTEAPPTVAPPPTLAPVSTPEPEPTATLVPSPKPVPAPEVTCVEENPQGPISPDQVVEYRCDYINGPVKPVLTFIEQGWEISRTGLLDSWTSRLDADLDEVPGESGTFRLYARATAEAVPGTAEISIDVRAGDFALDAPKVSLVLRPALLEPTPTPSPTPEPAIAFAPDVDCSAAGSVGSGQDTWAMQNCTATWKTEHVTKIVLDATMDTAALRIVAVESADVGAARLDTSSGVLTLTDNAPADSGFYSSKFSIGTKVIACSTGGSTQISLQLKAVSHKPVPENEAGEPLVDIATSPEVTETVKKSITAEVDAPEAPNISLTSASFTTVDLLSNNQVATGTFVLSYDDAPAHCGWQITVTLGDLVNGGHVIPVSNLQLRGHDGFAAHVSTPSPGTFVITPDDSATAQSGTITLTTTLALNEYVPQGRYQTTIKADAALSP